MTTEGPPSQPLDPHEPIAQIEDSSARRKRVARKLLRALVTIYCVLMVVLCGVPALVTMLAGAPVRLVKLKLAVVATPPTLAVTV